MVRNPVRTHAPISRAGESTSRAISAETRKMPDPIIEPITSMVALVRPRPLMNSRSGELVVSTVAGFVSTLNYPHDPCRGRCPHLPTPDEGVWGYTILAQKTLL